MHDAEAAPAPDRVSVPPASGTFPVPRRTREDGRRSFHPLAETESPRQPPKSEFLSQGQAFLWESQASQAEVTRSQHRQGPSLRPVIPWQAQQPSVPDVQLAARTVPTTWNRNLAIRLQYYAPLT